MTVGRRWVVGACGLLGLVVACGGKDEGGHDAPPATAGAAGAPLDGVAGDAAGGVEEGGGATGGSGARSGGTGGGTGGGTTGGASTGGASGGDEPGGAGADTAGGGAAQAGAPSAGGGPSTGGAAGASEPGGSGGAAGALPPAGGDGGAAGSVAPQGGAPGLDTTIDSGPPLYTRATTATFDFSASVEEASFDCRLDGEPWAECEPELELEGLAEGAHVLEVRARQGDEVDATPADWPWTVDLTAPDTTIVDAPAALGGAAASFTFSGSESPVTFRCSLDGGDFAPCPAEATFEGLAEGTHELEVVAVDAAGNEDPTPAAHAWTVDAEAPDTTITSAPTETVGGGEVLIAFTGSEAAVTFECRLDGGAWEACSSPWVEAGLPDGDHTLAVRAVDAAGNADPTPAAAGFTVDSSLPDTVITSGVSGATQLTTLVYEFVGTIAGSTFECRFDGSDWTPCNSPVGYASLADGEHSFAVRAIDPLDQVDATPATRTAVVDTLAPDTTITDGPSGSVNDSLVYFEFSSTEPEARLFCVFDTAAEVPCTSPWGISGLTDGPHTFSVRAIDAAGNADPSPAVRAFDVDRVAPDTTLTGGPAQGTVQCGVNDASFTLGSNEAGVGFQCRLDADLEPWACTSPLALTDLADGPHSLEVRAVDAAGNADPSPATRSFTIDTSPPVITVDGPGEWTSDDSPRFGYTTDETALVYCAMDSTVRPNETCPNPYLALELGDGSHTLYLWGRDACGNLHSTPVAYVFHVDATPPAMTITGSPATPSNDTTPTFTFTGTDQNPFDIECQIEELGVSPVWVDCASPWTPSSPLTVQGPKTFRVRGIDGAGNVGTATATFNLDLEAPVTSITAGPADGTRTKTSVSYSFVANDVQATFQCYTAVCVIPTSCTWGWRSCSSPASFSRNGDDGDGTYTFQVRATDPAGNTGSAATRSVVFDTTGPSVTISHVLAPTKHEYSFTTTATDLRSTTPFECSCNNAAYFACNQGQAYLCGSSSASATWAVRAYDDLDNVKVTSRTD